MRFFSIQLKTTIALFSLLMTILIAIQGCKKSDDKDSTPPKPPTGTETSTETNTNTDETIGTLSIDMTADASSALPQISALSADKAAALNAAGSAPVVGTIEISERHTRSYAIGDVVDLPILLEIFAYQCHSSYGPMGENLCPPTYILPLEVSKSPYKFAGNAIISVIHHGDLYMRQSYAWIPSGQSCDNLDCTTCDACYTNEPEKCQSSSANDYLSSECNSANRCRTQNNCNLCSACKNDSFGKTIPMQVKKALVNDNYTFVSTKGANGTAVTTGNSEKYVIKMPNVYNYYYEVNNQQVTEYRLFHFSSDNQKFADFNMYKDTDQGSVQQAYLTLSESGAGKIMAVNTTSVSTIPDRKAISRGRSILVTNFANKKFLLKQRSNAGLIVAAGVGGRDPKTGELYEGFYYTKATKQVESDPSSDVTFQGCIDNKTQKMVADTNCVEEKKLWNTGFDASVYLGLSSAESSDLSGFVSYFADASSLTDEQVALTLDDIKNFPDRIEISE